MASIVLPKGVKHYASRQECPDHLQKYYAQRHTLFSKYDDGVLLTDSAWYGVTPEPIATRIASDIATATPPEKKILIDAFAGAGGNTIAFAASGRWMRVYAIEKDEATLECAKKNAEVYGISDKIFWFLGDCFEVLKNQLKDLGQWSVVFGSPPWGGKNTFLLLLTIASFLARLTGVLGPTYTNSPVFDLSTMEPYSIQRLHDEFSRFTGDYALYLPRTSDLNQLAKFVSGKKNANGEQKKIAVEHYCINGASKALVFYNGRFEWT
ncbi:hypothetical protein KEM56_007267 [Ascosphaera pollenicola]|nr:hypothetical protein KEM56_007267 [Ascosphaera pollenicola]